MKRSRDRTIPGGKSSSSTRRAGVRLRGGGPVGTATAGDRFVIAGKHSYQITSPLIMRVLESGAVFDSMVLMMQREVADRLTAGPGTRRNGPSRSRYSISARSRPCATCRPTRSWPPPEVESRVLRFRLRPPALDIAERDSFFRLVDAAFAQRRKMLPNSVAGRRKGKTREQVEEALSTSPNPPPSAPNSSAWTTSFSFPSTVALTG